MRLADYFAQIIIHSFTHHVSPTLNTITSPLIGKTMSPPSFTNTTTNFLMVQLQKLYQSQLVPSRYGTGGILNFPVKIAMKDNCFTFI